jgi:hypothetical protein
VTIVAKNEYLIPQVLLQLRKEKSENAAVRPVTAAVTVGQDKGLEFPVRDLI